MRAVVLSGPGTVRVEDVPIPEPGPTQIRVRLEGCGICASNLEVWGGQPWFAYPLEPGAPGHEGWGIVDAMGSAVAGVSVGDRVAIISSHAFAEYDVTEARSAVKVPELFDGRPFPGEPLGCAVNIFRRSMIQDGETVAIVGIGFLGVILTRLASLAGARVIAVSRRRFALEFARRYGAHEAIEISDHRRVINDVMRLTGGDGCECVVEAVGRQSPLDLASELTRERGRLVIAGYHQDGPRMVNMQLWNWRGLDVINAHERKTEVYVAGMRDAVELVTQGGFDPFQLFTHTFPLERMAEGLDATRDRPDGFLKALVTL